MRRTEQSEGESKDTDPVQGNLLPDLPEWLEDFTENIMDQGVSASRGTPASTSRESDQELSRKVVSGNTVSSLISLKTEISKSARGPRLQGLLAGNAHW